jgi:thiamine biosynthesis lipoprotein
MSFNFQEFKKSASILCLTSLFWVGCSNKLPSFYTIKGSTQGTTYAIKYIATSSVIEKSSIDSLLLAFDMSLSTYRDDSKISLINANQSHVIVDDFFKQTFLTSERIYGETQGLFDPTVGILVNAYGFGPNGKKENLGSIKVDSLLQYVGFDKIRLDTLSMTLEKEYPQTYLDFNAIAQGYSVDVVAAFLLKKGITDFIVEIGGEIIGRGFNQIENKSWVVGIDNPLQMPEDEKKLIAKINLDDLGMATSGNYRKVITDAETGEKYVHIIHPITGLPEKGNVLSATVVCEKTIDADGYATAFMMMNLEEIKSFLQSKPNLFVLIVYMNQNNEMQQFQSENFEKLLVK